MVEDSRISGFPDEKISKDRFRLAIPLRTDELARQADLARQPFRLSLCFADSGARHSGQPQASSTVAVGATLASELHSRVRNLSRRVMTDLMRYRRPDDRLRFASLLEELDLRRPQLPAWLDKRSPGLQRKRAGP